jgi:hypothetical protein
LSAGLSPIYPTPCTPYLLNFTKNVGCTPFSHIDLDRFFPMNEAISYLASTSSEIAEWTKIAQAVIVSCCAVITTTLAFVGYNKWRHEMKGKSRYELAKSILKASCRVRRGISTVRDPCGYGFEAPPRENTSDGSKSFLDYAHFSFVYGNRWKTIAEPMTALEEFIIDAEVEFGKSFQDAIYPLRKLVAELGLALGNFLESTKGESGQFDSDPLKEDRSILYEHAGDQISQKFTDGVSEAIARLDREFRRFIE